MEALAIPLASFIIGACAIIVTVRNSLSKQDRDELSELRNESRRLRDENRNLREDNAFLTSRLVGLPQRKQE